MRVLLLEDDQILGEGLRDFLRAVGNVVEWATSVADAQLLAQEPCDVLLVDWQLPDGSGLDWLRRLRGKGVLTPALMLTSRDQLTDRIAGLDGGADDYLVKPCAPEELVARINAVRRRSVAQGATRQLFGALEVDITAGAAYVDGQRVNLTCNPNKGHYDKTVDAFFNTACVAYAGRGDIGNAPKDAVRGPGRSNFDLTLFRNFRLGSDQRTMTFRWEVYNAFNHTQFNSIDTTARFNPATGVQANPTFGQALGANPARQMQLSLRFKF